MDKMKARCKLLNRHTVKLSEESVSEVQSNIISLSYRKIEVFGSRGLTKNSI